MILEWFNNNLYPFYIVKDVIMKDNRPSLIHYFKVKDQIFELINSETTYLAQDISTKKLLLVFENKEDAILFRLSN